MDTTLLNGMLILWILVWASLLIAIWVWTEVSEIKSDKSRVNSLIQNNIELQQRIEGMERVMMRNGYRPPHKR